MARLIFALAILLVLTTAARAEDLEYCDKGKAALKLGANDHAIKYFTLCIDDGKLSEKTRATAFYNRGNAYYSKGEYDKAIADYDGAIRFKPENADAFGNRGTVYYIKGHYDLAIADFTQAIRLRPKDALAFNNRGNAYDERGDRDGAIADYDRAIADFTQAIQLDTLKGPRRAWPFNNRGNTYKAKGQYDLAIADYDRAIRHNPDYALAFYNRGHAYDDEGQYDRAITDYDRAIRLDPGYTAATKHRGYAKFNLGHFAAAVSDFAQAVESSPKDHYAVMDLYLAQARAGEGGLDDLKTNSGRLDLADWPGHVISMFLGRISPEAVAAMGTASSTKAEREKRCEAMFYVGQYHLLHDDRQKAVEFFSAAVATGITNFVEYKGAKAELARLREHSLRLGPVRTPILTIPIGDELFVAHSRDNPSQLWAGLDVTVEETQRDGRASIFKIHRHQRVVGGAAGRFFICTVLLLAKQRGYVSFSNARPSDGRHAVIFLKEYDEDIQALIDNGYREYEFPEGGDAKAIAVLEQLCTAASKQ